MKTKLNIILFSIILLIIFASCDNTIKKSNDVELVETKIVKAKTINHVDGTSFSRGYTNYIIAYTNGDTDYVTFGEYSNIELNDTITYTKMEDDFFWKLNLNIDEN